MKIIFGGSGGIQDALHKLAADSDAVSVAVSYIQLSGWRLFLDSVRHIDVKKIRIVCTEQLAITDPRAIKDAIEKKINIRRYNGPKTFHCKIYFGHTSTSTTRFLVGSANLSESALKSSIEAAIVGEDGGAGVKWFDDLYSERSVDFDSDTLLAMEKAFIVRAKSKITELAATPKSETSSFSEEIVESIFGTLGDVALLNLDQAANNVRNLNHALQVLRGGRFTGKQRSEMKLLGFAAGGKLNELGKKAAAAKDISELAKVWVEWLKRANGATLKEIGGEGRLVQAKLAFGNFWRLQPEVIEFFLAHAADPTKEEKRICQIIELLANVGPIARTLSFEQVKSLTKILDDVSKLSDVPARAIQSYLENKGARNWKSPDRPLILKAWSAK